jgi:three-Cys-motif partner protein
MSRDKGAVDERQARLIEIPEQPPKPLRVIAPTSPVWTENKAQFIMRYLRYFVYITKHGTYIDGFAGPQVGRSTDSWAAKLVLESEPKRLRHFHLCDASPAQIKHLEALKASQPEADSKGKKTIRDISVYAGDFNQRVDDILNAGTISDKAVRRHR